MTSADEKKMLFLDGVEAKGAARRTTMEDWRRAKLGGAPASSREGPEDVWRVPCACKDLGGSLLPATLPPWKEPCSSQAEYDKAAARNLSDYPEETEELEEAIRMSQAEYDKAAARNLSDYPEEAEELEEAIRMSLQDPEAAYPRKRQGLAAWPKEAEIEEAIRVSLLAFDHEATCWRGKRQEKEDDRLARELQMEMLLEEEERKLQQWRAGRQRQEAEDGALARRLAAQEESDAAWARSLAGL